MLILGISGGQSLPHEVSIDPTTWQHDAAAVLVEDGRIVAALEEERLNRIKHTSRAPLSSARFCLQHRAITGGDLDHVAFYWDDASLDFLRRRNLLRRPRQPITSSARVALSEFCATHLGTNLPLNRFHFVPHHLAHAMSAFALSGFERSLIVTLDGEGEQESGVVAIGKPSNEIEILTRFKIGDSLGYLYRETIAFLGYKLFDEYKVMGLAPYGDPARYQQAFEALYDLGPQGSWRLRRERFHSLYDIMTPRRKGEEFTQAHKDFAAGLQVMLERIVRHLLEHYSRTTQERNLCLAGGVAHNCTMNGRIVASGLFEHVFVQPAAHDAGAALGAALKVYADHGNVNGNGHSHSHGDGPCRIPRLEHLYWGPDIGADQSIQHTLGRWSDFVEFERVDDIFNKAAALMADGHVIGWVQGRSEFGPRALGNRSIVADPRAADNKTRINAMVKKREGYRPFAPSVLVEHADEYFVLPGGTNELPFMIVVVDVREDKRQLLGAVTHVDGSARVQTVSRKTNERFWRLIDAFKAITGVPVVLNTSFNNNVEPIVDSAADAIVCFLTTELPYLAIGDWLVRKKAVSFSTYRRLAVSIPAHYRVTHTRLPSMASDARDEYQLIATHDAEQSVEISKQTYDVLLAADGGKTVADLCAASGYAAEQSTEVLAELYELWLMRAVVLQPV